MSNRHIVIMIEENKGNNYPFDISGRSTSTCTVAHAQVHMKRHHIRIQTEETQRFLYLPLDVHQEKQNVRGIPQHYYPVSAEESFHQKSLQLHRYPEDLMCVDIV